MQTFTIRKPDDFHVHLRDGEMLRNVLRYTAQNFGRSLIMPNTIPPILTASDAHAYRGEIKAVDAWDHEPLMTIKLAASTKKWTIRDAKMAGVSAAKLYPEGVTTNSADGIRDFDALWPVFDAMEKEGMTLCLHGEHPDSFVLDRERDFLNVLDAIANDFPGLRIVLEHVSTSDAVERVFELPANVAATITVHHPVLTLDDVIGGMLQPHHFCKPVAKRPEDRAALLDAAMSGNPKFFLGTDSAPHLRGAKECASGCAGVFTAPVAMPILIELFESMGKLSMLENFTSVFGAQFYGLPLNKDTVTYRREEWTVPDEYHGVVPFKAGETLQWQVDRS